MDFVLDEEEEAAAEGRAAGCMAVQSYMTPGLRAGDPRITRFLDRARDTQVNLLEQAIHIGQLDGSIRADIAPPDGALLVLALISGIRVAAQAGAMTDALRAATRLGLRGIVT